jgi:hypothetical protein
MDRLFASNTTELFTKPITRILPTSFDEDIFVNSMYHELLMNYKQDISNLVTNIIQKEISKHKRIDLRKFLLIKTQLYNNLYENISNLIFNMAKDYYDNYVQQYVDINALETAQFTPMIDEFNESVIADNMFTPFNV